MLSAILFLDELDLIAPDRACRGGSDQLTVEIVGQLLQELDGMRVYDNHVFLMAATDRFEQVDRAVRSRFSVKQIGWMSQNSRQRKMTSSLR